MEGREQGPAVQQSLEIKGPSLLAVDGQEDLPFFLFPSQNGRFAPPSKLPPRSWVIGLVFVSFISSFREIYLLNLHYDQ